jgi:DNA invertase Pin-like site-specific DNA recombinase
MIAVLGGLADVERDLIRTRTGEGRDRAKARGVKLGRKPKLTDHQKREAIKRRNQGETLADIARSYNVSSAAIFEARSLTVFSPFICEMKNGQVQRHMATGNYGDDGLVWADPAHGFVNRSPQARKCANAVRFGNLPWLQIGG